MLEATERCRPCWYSRPTRSSVVETPPTVFSFLQIQVHDYSASTVPQYCLRHLHRLNFQSNVTRRSRKRGWATKINLSFVSSFYFDFHLSITFLNFHSNSTFITLSFHEISNARTSKNRQPHLPSIGIS